jgi:hypothetical protein
MGPVAAPASPRARQQGVSSALIGLVAVGVLAGGSWFLHERASANPSVSNGVTQAAQADAVRPAAAPKASPASAAGAVRSLDLDQASSTAHAVLPNNALPSNPGPNTAAPDATERSSAKVAKLEQPALAAQSEPAEPQKGADPQAPTTASADAATNGEETTIAVTETPAPAQLPPFDAQAAKHVLTASALSASSCRKGDDPRGTAEVIVTFAPSGRITSANVNGAPYGGTATGGCVAATLRGATVPPFAGNHVTVRKLVTIR